jgi:hypothetical protein
LSSDATSSDTASSDTASSDTVSKRLVQLGTDPRAGLRVVAQFAWHVDRYIHKISLIPVHAAGPSPSGDDSRIRVANTGADDPRWPLSPPLQQLDVCTLGDGRQGLVGLGMAGSSHWSLAVVAEEQWLWFDVACRVQQPPGFLQTAYRLDEGCEVVPNAPSSAHSLMIVRESAAAGGLQLCVDAPSTEWVVGPGCEHIRLRPKHASDELPATIRWRYGFAATA